MASTASVLVVVLVWLNTCGVKVGNTLSNNAEHCESGGVDSP